MTLSAGVRLGPYEIVAPIGAGGMGEVYRARDTRLNRTVALKILSGASALDPAARDRFTREAHAIAALNHPNICVLHDIGSSSAPETGGAPLDYLVMEYLDGETLAHRLRSGPLPLDQALEIGAQVADALARAHRHGIVHRDLKPGNIMLTKSGAGLQAKLLDFGLAKLRSQAAAPGLALSALPTEAPATTPGMVLGTVPYMAPEQLEGKEADASTDLFAFGAVLYEMLTGRGAFAGASAASIISAIMSSEPPPIATLQPVTPPALDRLVRRCLAKDPEVRCDSAHDVADELRWIRETGGGAASSSAQLQRRRGRQLAIFATVGLAMAVVGAGLMWLLRPSAPRATVMYKALPVGDADELYSGGSTPGYVFTPGGSLTALAWTPDGQALVFVGLRNGVQQLYVRRLDAPTAQPIKGTEGAQAPAISADGQVAFWADSKIKKIPLIGGPVDVVASGPGLEYAPWGLAWDDQRRLFYGLRNGEIWMIDADGKRESKTKLERGELSHVLPCPLPGGRVVLYTVRKRNVTWGDEELVALTMATGTRTPLLRDAADARYVPTTGHLVFLRQGQLFAAPFDPDSLKVGQARPLLDHVAQALISGAWAEVTGAGQFSVSSGGTLAWLRGPTALPFTTGKLVAVDRKGGITPLPARADSYGSVRLSPDGRRLVVAVDGLTSTGLWEFDLERAGGLTSLLLDGEANYPLWLRDGRLAFAWLKDGRESLAALSANGAQVLEPGQLYPSALSQEGQILATRNANSRPGTVVVTEGQGKVSVRSLMETEHEERSAALSPDGRWLAYESRPLPSDPWQKYQVYVRSYPDLGPAVQVSFENGFTPAWNPKTGRELFFTEWHEPPAKCRMMVVDFTPGAPGTRPRPGTPRELFTFEERDLQGFICGGARCYDVSPDGQKFYAVQVQSYPARPVVTHINLIENFFEELRNRVPTKK
jgi:eukaryotic-like serine/threonine-protein kinase